MRPWAPPGEAGEGNCHYTNLINFYFFPGDFEKDNKIISSNLKLLCSKIKRN